MAVRAALRLGQFSDADAKRVSTLLQCAVLPVSGQQKWLQ